MNGTVIIDEHAAIDETLGEFGRFPDIPDGTRDAPVCSISTAAVWKR